MEKILIADIGGTNARFAIYHNKKIKSIKKYESKKFTSLKELLNKFLSEIKSEKIISNKNEIKEAYIGIAAPTISDKIKFTNNKITFSKSKIQKEFKFKKLIVVNDLIAHIHSIPILKKSNIVELKRGCSKKQSTNNIGSIAIGTGLGSSVMKNQKNFIATEAGHNTLTGITKRQKQVINIIKKEENITSEELLRQGALTPIYKAICKINKKEELQNEFHKSYEIQEASLKNNNDEKTKLAKETLTIFCEFLGIFIYNFSTSHNLKSIYIFSKIFRNKYTRKFLKSTKFSDYINNPHLSIFIITEEDTALKGVVNFYNKHKELETNTLKNLTSKNIDKKINDIIKSKESKNIIKYINKTWKDLKRNSIENFQDKITKTSNNIIYVSKNEDIKKLKEIHKNEISKKNIKLKQIPNSLKELDLKHKHGILYLPNSYITPGGRFNEMYGWDSYFINLGLLENKKNIKIAKNMVENHLYQIENYGGKILNGNRTYYLDRSQPPFISQMVLDIFNITKDKKWLAETLPQLIKYFNFWTSGKRYIKELNLYRYYSTNSTPAYEVSNSKNYNENSYYEKLRTFFETNKLKKYEPFFNYKNNKLTKDFFTADRSCRESGMDISEQFGVFGTEINNYAPICLNSLMYKMITDISKIYNILENKKSSKLWLEKSKTLKESINKYCWNEKIGIYFSYDIKNKKKSNYIYATTFYPMFCELASKDQAKKLVKNLKLLEQESGISCSTNKSGNQWDLPFGWAPIQYITIKGLENYNFKTEAKRISIKWINKINNDFKTSKGIYEKYNVTNNHEATDIMYGYNSNEIGFGWSNGVYLHLINKLK